jgi:hypothetical protein
VKNALPILKTSVGAGQPHSSLSSNHHTFLEATFRAKTRDACVLCLLFTRQGSHRKSKATLCLVQNTRIFDVLYVQSGHLVKLFSSWNRNGLFTLRNGHYNLTSININFFHKPVRSLFAVLIFETYCRQKLNRLLSANVK